MKMWICRNTNGSLALFEDEPEYDDVWDWWTPSRISKQNRQIYLNMVLFPEVTFENSPMEVELVIKEYPKTYEECCKVLGIDTLGHSADGYKWEILSTFQNLLICRDAYWKIAGEEMGLGKPWKPDWEDEHQEKYIMGSWLGTIQGLEENFVSHPFAFPTPEMRDDFYENFKELVEQCKELL